MLRMLAALGIALLAAWMTSAGNAWAFANGSFLVTALLAVGLCVVTIVGLTVGGFPTTVTRFAFAIALGLGVVVWSIQWAATQHAFELARNDTSLNAYESAGRRDAIDQAMNRVGVEPTGLLAIDYMRLQAEQGMTVRARRGRTRELQGGWLWAEWLWLCSVLVGATILAAYASDKVSREPAEEAGSPATPDVDEFGVPIHGEGEGHVFGMDSPPTPPPHPGPSEERTLTSTRPAAEAGRVQTPDLTQLVGFMAGPEENRPGASPAPTPLSEPGSQDIGDDSPERAELAASIHHDDPDAIQQLVARGLDINYWSSSGELPLEMAVRFEKPRAVRKLLELGAGPFQQPRGNWTTPWHAMAGSPRWLELMRELAPHGEVDVRGFGGTALHTAAHAGCLPAFELLLELGADPLARDGDECTVLHRAVDGDSKAPAQEQHEARLAIARRGIELGVDPRAIDRLRHRTARAAAASRGFDDMVHLLGEAEAAWAHRPALAPPTDPRGLPVKPIRPLEAAAAAGCHQLAERLLAEGEPLTADVAIMLGNWDDADRLLQSFDARSPEDQPGGRILGLAIKHQAPARLLRAILEHGADPAGRGLHRPALLEAATEGTYEAVELLIKAGAHPADPQMTDCDLNTPLHQACRRDDIGIVRLLLCHGAPPDTRTERGYPPAYFTSDSDIHTLLESYGGPPRNHRASA